MEPSEITFITVLLLGILWNMWIRKREQERPKRIAVVEDSDDDFMMFKLFFHLDNVIIDRYKTADNLPLIFAKNKPDAVIADYYLDGCIRGDQLIRLCDKFKIPSLLVTGGSQKIEGVPEQRILRKSPDREYFGRITEWAQHQFA